MPNEMVIQHRDVIWDQVFKNEYLPWVEQCGNQRPFKDVRGWKRISEDALRELSIQEYGTDLQGNPKQKIVLRTRANHSNFAECKICAAGRQRELNAIKARAPKEERDKIRMERSMHRQEWRSERSAMGLRQKQVSESMNSCYMLDDKLGGQWIYHPIPCGNREDKGTSSNWKYRCTLQGVTLTGKRHLFSIIPPCVQTGNNFGVTAFVSGVLECMMNESPPLVHLQSCLILSLRLMLSTHVQWSICNSRILHISHHP